MHCVGQNDWVFFYAKNHEDFKIMFHEDSLYISTIYIVCSGDRAFSVAAPALWNVLPLSIKVSSSMDIFKKDLKTYLFYQAFGV